MFQKAAFIPRHFDHFSTGSNKRGRISQWVAIPGVSLYYYPLSLATHSESL